MDESLRLNSVERFASFDMAKDTELLQLVQIASEICDSPIASINLLDKDTQWIKVSIGSDIISTPRNLSFCNDTISNGDLVIVADTSHDRRFISHPLVIGDPNIRFYAGAPLITTDGLCLGTLCVIGQEPRQIDRNQQLMLKMLAKQVMIMMELKLKNHLLEENEKEVMKQKQINMESDIKLRSFFESSVNFHVLLGRDFEVLDYNKTAYRFIKNAYARILTRKSDFTDYIEPSFRNIFIDRYIACLDGLKAYEEGYTDYPELGRIWWEASFEPAINGDKQIIGVSYSIRNVTDRKLYEQKILAQNEKLKEISYIQSHEYRGPLASIMGLMNIIKMENYVATYEYLEMMDIAINRLDDKIREVVKVANEVNAMPV